jgi:hypothetical protein
MTQRKYWPLDYDPEGEIYDSVSWDLPGFRPNRRTAPRSPKVRRPARKSG